jgi:GrpB-like predicted nucleotidyltransferase (UPF0157 family)
MPTPEEEDDVDETDSAGSDELTDEPIRIVPYDPTWPERFEQERAALRNAIGEWVVDGAVHHVGSTAVPGLAAKPVIDVLVGVRSLEESRACFGRLGAIGYVYFPYRSEEMHWFCKPNPKRRTHHLHLTPVDGERFRDELAFRDYLRAHKDVAEEYGALKRRLAEEFTNDREAYTEAKTELIRGTLLRTFDRHGRD